MWDSSDPGSSLYKRLSTALDVEPQGLQRFVELAIVSRGRGEHRAGGYVRIRPGLGWRIAEEVASASAAATRKDSLSVPKKRSKLAPNPVKLVTMASAWSG